MTIQDISLNTAARHANIQCNVVSGNLLQVKTLVQNIADRGFATLLAINAGQQEIVSALLAEGELSDNDRCDCMQAALFTGKFELLRPLLRTERDFLSALAQASAFNQSGLIRQIRENSNISDKDFTVLVKMNLGSGKIENLKALIQSSEERIDVVSEALASDQIDCIIPLVEEISSGKELSLGEFVHASIIINSIINHRKNHIVKILAKNPHLKEAAFVAAVYRKKLKNRLPRLQ